MNEKILATLINNLIDSKEKLPFKKDFKIPKFDGFFTVTITYKERSLLLDSVSLESFGRAQTISALPHGAPCGCCNGSGKSS